MKEYTGKREDYIKCLNYLLDLGYEVENSKAIHLGDRKYEFEEGVFGSKVGCYDIHKILAHIDENEEVKIKTKVIGSYCLD